MDPHYCVIIHCPTCAVYLIKYLGVRIDSVLPVCLLAKDVCYRKPLIGEVVDQLIYSIFEPCRRKLLFSDTLTQQAPKFRSHLREGNSKLRCNRFDLPKRSWAILEDGHLATATLGELMQQQPPLRQLDGLLQYMTALSYQLRAVVCVLCFVHR